MAVTAIMLIKFCLAIAMLIRGGSLAPPSLRVCALAVVSLSSRALVPKKMAGQAAQQPDPDAFLAEVCPRSLTTMAWVRTQKLKGTGKPELTRADGP